MVLYSTEDFQYEITDFGTVIIVGYNGNEKIIKIPETISGCIVTSLGDFAFNECTATNIILPNTLTKIGCSTFFKCKSLESIEIPETVTSIGDAAFFECTKLKSIKIPKMQIVILCKTSKKHKKYTKFYFSGMLLIS